MTNSQIKWFYYMFTIFQVHSISLFLTKKNYLWNITNGNEGISNCIFANRKLQSIPQLNKRIHRHWLNQIIRPLFSIFNHWYIYIYPINIIHFTNQLRIELNLLIFILHHSFVHHTVRESSSTCSSSSSTGNGQNS